jgi:ribosomal protein L11 methyltransferase
MPSFRAAVPMTDEAAARAFAGALEAAVGDAVPVSWSETADQAWQVEAYWEGPDAATEKAVRTVAKTAGVTRSLLIEELADIDWVTKTLEGLAPIRAGRFVVHGSHDRAKPLANDIAIEIDAAQAFGTGHHGTTAGCLEALFDLHKTREFRSALDVGTGTGVLAIAIAKLWKIPVLASDIDPVAVRIAAENARTNRVFGGFTAVEAVGFGHPLLREGQFDLIVANILAGPLARLAPNIARHLTFDGVVVLSGLLPPQRARILAAYSGQGLRHRRSLYRDGWLTLVLGP